MYIKNKKGLTLVESLISIMLLSVLLVGLLAAFFISKIGTLRAKHRIAAMSRVREYMEQELRAGYLGGYVDGDFYVTAASGNTVPVTIDDRGTAGDTSDDLVGTLKASPYPAPIASIGAIPYKTVGFVVEWSEDVFGNGPASTCRERAITYVPERS